MLNCMLIIWAAYGSHHHLDHTYFIVVDVFTDSEIFKGGEGVLEYPKNCKIVM